MEANELYLDLPQLPLRAKVLKFVVDYLAVILFFGFPLIIIPFMALVFVNWIYYQHGSRGGGSPIVSTRRIGKYGRPFRFYQLRTHTKSGVLTPFGEWVKKWALDELPQIINIALRQMSTVGPRPVTPDELARYQDVPGFTHRFGALPGVCGVAIGTFTNTEAIAEGYKSEQTLRWIPLDRDYIAKWTLALEWLAYKLSAKDAKRGHDPTPKSVPATAADLQPQAPPTPVGGANTLLRLVLLH